MSEIIMDSEISGSGGVGRKGDLQGRGRRGFTLIELMVVIGIIVILIAILLPALSSARAQAYKVQTTALLTGLSNDCETYFTTFDSYPGPAQAGVTGTYAGPTTTGANKISGNQNLFIALTYSMYAGSTVPATVTNANGVAMPGTPATVVDSGNASGPIDLTTGKAYQAFYNPNAKEIGTYQSKGPPAAWYAGGVNGAAGGNSFKFPCIVDRYPDGLPILYFRRTPGTEGSVTIAADYSTSSQTMVSEAATSPAPYYRSENSEYLDSTGLTATSGRIYTQSGVSGLSGASSTSDNNLAALFAGQTASTTYNAHGGFVLMSAGEDRIYGQNTKKSNKSDDIVITGGH